MKFQDILLFTKNAKSGHDARQLVARMLVAKTNEVELFEELSGVTKMPGGHINLLNSILKEMIAVGRVKECINFFRWLEENKPKSHEKIMGGDIVWMAIKETHANKRNSDGLLGESFEIKDLEIKQCQEIVHSINSNGFNLNKFSIEMFIIALWSFVARCFERDDSQNNENEFFELNKKIATVVRNNTSQAHGWTNKNSAAISAARVVSNLMYDIKRQKNIFKLSDKKLNFFMHFMQEIVLNDFICLKYRRCDDIRDINLHSISMGFVLDNLPIEHKGEWLEFMHNSTANDPKLDWVMIKMDECLKNKSLGDVGFSDETMAWYEKKLLQDNVSNLGQSFKAKSL